MSVVDEIHCKMSLPADAPEFLKDAPFFQTSDLGKSGNEYQITKDGEFQITRTILGDIVCQALEITEPPPPTTIEWKRKKIEMYASNLRAGGPRDGQYTYFTEDGSDYISICYVVQIRNGKVSSIKEKFREAKSALPISEF